MVEQVRLCQVCGHINPGDGTKRCNNCSSFSGLITVTQAEAEQLAYRRRLRLFRSRLLRLALPLAIIIGLTVWAAVSLFNLGPSPPSAATSISTTTTRQTWAQSRRTAQNSGFTPQQAPVPQMVKWTYATSQPLLAAPAVVDDRIFLTTEDGRTVALDRQTGQSVWEYSSGLPSSSTPAVAGGLVIFCLRPGLVTTLDRDTGTLVWERDLGSPIYASPLIVSGTVYIGAGDSNLHALDAATGEKLWTFPTDDWVVSSAAYANDTVVVASQGSHIYIIDAKTGRQRLLYDTSANRLGTAPVIQGDLVYLTSDGGRVWAIDRQAKSYPFERFIWRVKVNFYVWQVLSELPLQKGSVWVRRLGGEIEHTPAVAHHTVYVTSTRGKVFALDAASGEEQWTTDLGVEVTAAPTVAGETVLIGTREGIVFGLDARNGAVMWDFPVGSEITDSPIVAGDTIYVVTREGKLHAITGPEQQSRARAD